MFKNNHLIQHIKKKQTQKRKKQAFEPDIFTRIYTMLKMYGTRERFFKKPDKKHLEAERPWEKTGSQFPLFALTSKEEYETTMAIMAEIENSFKNTQ